MKYKAIAFTHSEQPLMRDGHTLQKFGEDDRKLIEWANTELVADPEIKYVEIYIQSWNSYWTVTR